MLGRSMNSLSIFFSAIPKPNIAAAPRTVGICKFFSSFRIPS